MSQIVRNEVVQTSFGFYSDEDVELMSSCKVFSPLSLDSLGNIISGGLMDGRMGPMDSSSSNCLTCGQSYKDCTGHCGHIELCSEVYHPLLFSELYEILRCKCFFCHNLKMVKKRVRVYFCRIKLLCMGDVKGAQDLEDLYNYATNKSISSDDKKNNKNTNNNNNDDDDDDDDVNMDTNTEGEIENVAESDLIKEKTLENALFDAEEKYSAFTRSKSTSSSSSSSSKANTVDSHARQCERRLIEEFRSESLKVGNCRNCGAFSPGIRKDGHEKLFRKPTSKKFAGVNEKLGLKLQGALKTLHNHNKSKQINPNHDDSAAVLVDSDDEGDANGELDDFLVDGIDVDSDAEGDFNNGVREEKEMYLPPIEVQAHLELLWLKDNGILDYIWGRGRNKNLSKHTTIAAPSSSGARGADLSSLAVKDSWRLFFMKNVIVPPNCFRPISYTGDVAAEHPQNKLIGRLIRLNEAVVQLNTDYQEACTREKDASDGHVQSSEMEIVEDEDGNPTETKVVKVSSSSDIMTRMMSTWVEIQNTINIYMDGSKDANVLGSSAPGIRQLLERKAGMFRMNMMGKRVNFCCRSVISPDPYLGMDEVGIPLHFAKGLHYPVPVTEWNAKLMRKLVENGPDIYPGKYKSTIYIFLYYYVSFSILTASW